MTEMRKRKNHRKNFLSSNESVSKRENAVAVGTGRDSTGHSGSGLRAMGQQLIVQFFLKFYQAVRPKCVVNASGIVVIGPNRDLCLLRFPLESGGTLVSCQPWTRRSGDSVSWSCISIL